MVSEHLQTLPHMPPAVAPDMLGGLNRKRIVLLLRAVVIATAAYLVLAHRAQIELDQIIYVALFAASNIALLVAPQRVFYLPQFGPLLLLADTAFILFGLSITTGLSQDLLLVYFFTIFLTTIGESLGQIAVGAALIGTVYGYWLWASGSAPLQSEAWVRIPFLFLLSIFYAALTEQLKTERRRRQDAEQQSAHLRLLLDLGSVFSETHATREFVHGIGRFIEGTCAGLRCEVRLQGDATDPTAENFPLRAHGQEYGGLYVRVAEGRELTESERWLCQIVSHAAAGALYAAEQSVAAKEVAEIKQQFLSVISHEFRTPLHAILGYLDMIDGAVDSAIDTMTRESLERIRVNSCRLQDLLEQVIGFAEIRAGRRAVQAETVEIPSMVDDLAIVVRELLAGKPVTFAWRIAKEAEVIRTDRRKLQRILACLLGNAAKFTEAGWVNLSVVRDGPGWVEFVVADSGIGIPASELPSVFEDFRQVDGSYTRRYGGLGLGLALASELVEVLGGVLRLDSNLGEGTTVRLRIPDLAAASGSDQQVTAPIAPERAATDDGESVESAAA